jgi:hypothetical protein
MIIQNAKLRRYLMIFVPFCTILYHFVPKLYGGWFEWDENDVPWNPTYFVSKLLHSSEWCTVHNVISTTFRHLVEPMLNRLGPSPRFFAHGKHSDDFVFLCFSCVSCPFHMLMHLCTHVLEDEDRET